MKKEPKYKTGDLIFISASLPGIVLSCTWKESNFVDAYWYYLVYYVTTTNGGCFLDFTEGSLNYYMKDFAVKHESWYEKPCQRSETDL